MTYPFHLFIPPTNRLRRKRWHSLFNGKTSLAELKHALRDKHGGGPCEDGLRSVCWKVSFSLHETAFSLAV